VTKSSLSEFRDALRAALYELSDKELSSREIAQEFRGRNPAMLRQFSKHLEDIALVKMIGELGSRRGNFPNAPGQGELFEQLHLVPPISVFIDGSRKKRVRKRIVSMSIEEIDGWISDHSVPRISNQKQCTWIQALMEKLRPYCRPGMTVEDALRLYEADRPQ
jgi:hypothetical protein